MSNVKFTKNESLSFYAKLLAKENLNVVHANIETAAFHSQSKTVILPNFNSEVPEETKVHLASHEVSHFLNPADYQYEVEHNGRKAAILNIIDDCRIEKDILERFVGLNYFYKRSYKYIDESGFFEGKSSFTNINPNESIEVTPEEDMIFLDRLNRHLKLNKIGNRDVDIKFTSEEAYAVKLSEDVKTWEDVLVAHDEVLKLHKQEMKEHPERFKDGDPTDNYNPLNTSDMTDENIQEVSLDEFIEMLENGQIDENSIIEVKREKYSKKSEKPTKPQNKPSKSKKKSKKKKKSEKYDIKQSFDDCLDTNTYQVLFDKFDKNIVDDYKKFLETHKKTKNTDIVQNYLNEKRRTIRDMMTIFNRLKNAKQKLNQKFTDYGDINFDRMIHYKTEEKIFKSTLIKNRSKNHGFVMLLDFSGSMDNVLPSLSDQIIRLCEFCYKTQIPYKVYLFTSTWSNRCLKTVDGLNPVKGTTLIEALSSENPNRLEAFTKFKDVCIGDSRYSSGGTPIYSSMLLMPRLLAEFQNKYKVDKLNFFVFTDGDDNDGVTNNGKTMNKFGKSTLVFKDIRATIEKAPECYFDNLNIFYQMFKQMFDMNITTFFMSDNPYRHFNSEVKSQYNKDVELFKTTAWGDLFYTMSEDYFKDDTKDSLFIKTLMKDIL